MEKRIITVVFGLMLMAGMLYAQPAADSTQTRPQPGQGHGPRFVDMNGDGINDLAPDRDGDGIPDALDPMFQGPQARHRLGWYRSMPDSVMSDSLAFRSWWEQAQRRPNWQDAWNHWRSVVRDAGGIDALRDRWNRAGLTPREVRRKIIEDRRRRASGGSGGSGGGGGGGGGNGGTGRRGGGRG